MFSPRISIIGLFFFLCIPAFSYAASTEKEGGVTKTEHAPHPPHDHQDHDHLKYIRGHGTDRKKKKSSTTK